MRKLLSLGLAVGLLTLASGCINTHMSGNSSPLGVSTAADIRADLNIGGPISGEATINRILFFQWGPTEFADGVAYSMVQGNNMQALPFPLALLANDRTSMAKSAAAYQALSNSQGSEIIVNPRYTVTIKDFIVFQQIHARVEGHGASVAGYQEIQ